MMVQETNGAQADCDEFKRSYSSYIHYGSMFADLSSGGMVVSFCPETVCSKLHDLIWKIFVEGRVMAIDAKLPFGSPFVTVCCHLACLEHPLKS